MISGRRRSLPLLLLLLLPTLSLCWPNGAPSGACSSMTPKHRASPQNSVPPYQLQVNALDLMTFEVTLDGASSKSSPFRGFIVQAKDDDGNIIGTFDIGLEPAARHLECSSAFDTITHKSRDDKYDVTMRWNAPPVRFSGKVHFEASVVQYKTTFWTGIESEVFEVPAAGDGGIDFPGGQGGGGSNGGGSRPGGEGGFGGHPGGEGGFAGGDREPPPPGGQGGHNPDAASGAGSLRRPELVALFCFVLAFLSK